MSYLKSKIFTKNSFNMISNITKDIHHNGINIYKSTMASSPQFIIFDIETDNKSQKIDNIVNTYNNIDLNEALGNYNYDTKICNLKNIKINCADNTGIIYESCNILKNMNINVLNFVSDSYPAPFTNTNVFTLEMNIRVPKEVINKEIEHNMQTFIEKYNVDLSLKDLN